jgi:hypothetical protein
MERYGDNLMLRRAYVLFALALLGAVFAANDGSTARAATANGTISLSGSSFTVSQSAGSVKITVNRTGGSSGQVHAYYGTQFGTALDGPDYINTYGRLYWASGDVTPRTISIPINNAKPFAGTKALSFGISPSTGAAIGTPSRATITIDGDAGASTLALSSSNYTIPQTASALTVTVKRAGGTSGVVSVTHTTSNGTAVAGTNFTPTTGTLQWAAGDVAPKSFTVPISNATPFSGSKTFTVALTNPSGAAISTPATAGVAITGSGGSVGTGPAAPAGLLMTGQTASSIALSWPAAAGTSHYQIFRDNVAYTTTTATSYVDYGAIDATNVSLNAPAKIYTYAVAAVNAQGTEGAKSTQTTFDVYTNGQYYWAGDYSYGASINYKDTAGIPESGAYDIAVHVLGQGGGFQPYAGDVVPFYDLEAGSFGYISMDLKPTVNGQAWRLSIISRLPPGDVYPWASVNLANYGPAPVAGKWATYKVPLSALSIGNTSFVGSISGTTLTVSKVNSGVGVDAGGFVTGPGVKAGTYIIGHNANGGPGTYTIYPAQTVASTTMGEQRTTVYKFDVIDESGQSTNTYYVDNVKFTAE